MLIVETYPQHSLLMFNNLPKQNDYKTFEGGDSKRKFFDALLKAFTRKAAVALGGRFKLAAHTVDEVLRAAVGDTPTKLKAEHYEKT